MFQPLVQDIRYAGRLLFRSPGFTAIAILTLGLGIGANTAIFSVVHALVLRPLPYAEPERLVTVWQDLRARGGPADEWATPGNYADWRRETALFTGVAVLTGWRPTLTGGAEPEPVAGEQVSHEYFGLLGIRPSIGRDFAEGDDVPGAARVVVIGPGLWKRHFGGDPTAVGRILTLSGEPHEIIGILSEGFRPIVSPDAEIWRPLRLNTTNPARGAIVLRAVARLADGVTPDEARARADALARQLEAAHPEFNEKAGINLIPLHERVVGEIRPGLLALLGAVAFVLLIACANIANLLLARGSARAREVAVRAALGAGRGRVVRQLLTESLVLAFLGGAAGVLVASWALPGLLAIAPSGIPRMNEVAMSTGVFLFAVMLVFPAGLLVGVVPAMQLSRRDLARGLKAGARTGASVEGLKLRRALIVSEVALALTLLAGGGLLFQTFVSLQSADLGFDPENVLVAGVNPPPVKYDTAAKYRAYYDQALDKAEALPGVRLAALSSVLPLSGDTDTDFTIDGAPQPRSRAESSATWFRSVSASYFETMGMRIVRGRAFAPAEAERTAVINETFARRHFNGEDPLGRRIRLGDPSNDPFTIVGIVADARARGARREAIVETYLPYWHSTQRGMNIILRTAIAPLSVAPALRGAISSIDPTVPLSTLSTLEEIVGDSIEVPRFIATVATVFAGLALLLAALGLYGVMAYVVTQRTQEIGVRLALGATPSGIFRLVAADGLKVTAIGIAIGLTGAIAVSRSLETLLFEVRPGDPLTLAGTSVALFAVAALACVVPARRATRVDPVVALRQE